MRAVELGWGALSLASPSHLEDVQQLHQVGVLRQLVRHLLHDLHLGAHHLGRVALRGLVQHLPGAGGCRVGGRAWAVGGRWWRASAGEVRPERPSRAQLGAAAIALALTAASLPVATCAASCTVANEPSPSRAASSHDFCSLQSLYPSMDARARPLNAAVGPA